ncbi:MAG: hypothetical protein JRI49_06735 [Deltaproteobacteria bacterium]|nr:hypothetical protein [Deltaproteobacteria bacterium]
MTNFESIIDALIRSTSEGNNYTIYDAESHFSEGSTEAADIASTLNSAFLISIAGDGHPLYGKAQDYLKSMLQTPTWKDVAKFYTQGIAMVQNEIKNTCNDDPEFADRLRTLLEWMSKKENVLNKHEAVERIWTVFFPEGVGVQSNQKECIDKLRAKRTVNICQLSTSPVSDPIRQVIFTSNVLLTIPPASKSLEEFQFSNILAQKLNETIHEDQLYWYDHPIQIGVEPEKNEVLYGLRGLDDAVGYEHTRGNFGDNAKLICVLSVSVTHRGLQKIAKTYLEEEFAQSGGLKNVDVLVFTEADTNEIINEVLTPAAGQYLQNKDAKDLLAVFGVDGEYGRHYSFLKAIAAFWNIFIQPEIKATFKIDLDQVFPQDELVKESGSTAFEHLMSPLWGAVGTDPAGNPVELGMIAGSLVNQKDIEKSIFSPDVPFPHRDLTPDEHIFFSILPQALSTEAEMLTRYNGGDIDGIKKCIQRIHVTGGTVGILVDSLFKYRPFTPSFIGRAEDQAYILSVLNKEGTQLAYAHEYGLIMRHDKEAFAQEAIETAYIGKLVGDYVRILYFSAYAKVLDGNTGKIKDIADPFTGCFISRIPSTVVYLCFALKASSFFTAYKAEQGVDFIKTGAKRIGNALDFVMGEHSKLKKQYKKERLGWDLFFDTLLAVEKAIKAKDKFALDLCDKAKSIVEKCLIRFD